MESGGSGHGSDVCESGRIWVQKVTRVPNADIYICILRLIKVSHKNNNDNGEKLEL